MNKPSEEFDVLTIEDLARKAFEQIGYQQLSVIELVSNDGVLILKGTLNSFYLKQVAQSVAVKIPGVTSVRNEIEVR